MCVIGAGSSYTPEIIEGLFQYRDKLPVREIVLYDIDRPRLDIMYAFCQRYMKHLGCIIALRATTDRRDALENADFVNVQIRVGGSAARVRDERIPISYGLIGQETTGAGGFMKALRTVPVMIGIAKDVEKYCPDAWIINYTNPTGIVAEGVNRYTKAKIAGLCAGGFFPRKWVSRTLGCTEESVKYDYFGLNHMNFAYHVTVDGRPLTDAEFDEIADHQKVEPAFIKRMRLLCSPYCTWYFRTSFKTKQLMETKQTRGELVQIMEKELFEKLMDPAVCTKPEELDKRGGGGYSEIALGVMDAIYNNQDRWMVINVPNNGVIRFLPDDAVIETGCLVNASGIHPVGFQDIPKYVWGLVSAVKNYEQLTVEAAVTGDRDIALMALMAHPLVKDYDIAAPLLDDMLEANKEYLGNFFR